MIRSLSVSFIASAPLLVCGLLLSGGCTDVITYSRQSREKGMEYYAQGNYDDAAGAFQNAIRQQPADYRSHYYLGSCYAQDKAYHQAVQQYRTCLAIMPNSLEGRSDHAFRVKALDSLASAMALAGGGSVEANTLSQQAKSSEDYFVLGKLNRKLGDADAALQAYHQATLLDPKDFDVAKEYALYLVKLNQIEQADPELRRAYAMNSDDQEINEGLRQIGIVPGPGLKRQEDLAKPIIPEGPIPTVDLSKVRLQSPFKDGGDSAATSAQVDQSQSPKD